MVHAVYRAHDVDFAGVLSATGLYPKFNVVAKVDSYYRVSPMGKTTVKISVLGDRYKIKSFQEQLASLLRRAQVAGPLGLGAVDLTLLEHMTVMGFDRTRSHCALICGGSDVNVAVQWLQERLHVSTDALVKLARQRGRASGAHFN
jgi:hypothetical protein